MQYGQFKCSTKLLCRVNSEIVTMHCVFQTTAVWIWNIMLALKPLKRGLEKRIDQKWAVLGAPGLELLLGLITMLQCQ
eukprot:scaffold11784_cov19-Tisochrysis_lutea.AAC.1